MMDLVHVGEIKHDGDNSKHEGAYLQKKSLLGHMVGVVWFLVYNPALTRIRN